MTMQSWSWWSRPRAVAIGGRTFVQVIDETGTVTVLTYTGTSTTPTKTAVATIDIDDHNDGALIVAPGKPAISVYGNHAGDNVIRVKVSTVNIENGVDFTGVTETHVTAADPTTYAVTAVHGTDVYVMFRTTGTPWTWSFTKSTDWGATWSPVQRLFQCDFQFYGGSVRSGPHTWRVTMSTHPVNGSPPDQNIYYCEIDLSTGYVTKSDGTILGNLNGTNLPIPISSLEFVAAPPAGDVTWTWDVSDNPNEPEIVWGSFTPPNANLPTTGAYWYSRRIGNTWRSYRICASGNYFSAGEEPYMGGAQMPVNTPGGRVYVAREDGGHWYVERRDTPNKGTTWAAATLATNTDRLARCWPVENRDGSPSFDAVAEHITSWLSYNVHNSVMLPLPAVTGGWMPLAVERWNGSTWQQIGLDQRATYGWLPVVAERATP